MHQPSDAGVPPRHMIFGEAATLIRRPFAGGALRRIAAAHPGDGRAVLVLPGFLAHDILTRRLRRTLDAAGYRSAGWGRGINRGLTPAVLAAMVAQVERLSAAAGAPIALVGWSLGGLYARELAKLRPAQVERVVTLGSPFAGDLRANRAWRLYERINGYPVDRPPVTVDLAAKPPVPTIALWTACDGIVSPASSRGGPESSDLRVRVDCRHIDFVSSPIAISAILKALAR